VENPSERKIFDKYLLGFVLLAVSIPRGALFALAGVGLITVVRMLYRRITA
jgi:hypothetical protein